MINCRPFLAVAELCAIVYLRAPGRKLDVGQCVTLRGAAFTLPRWGSGADAAQPSTRPGLSPSRSRPSLSVCFECVPWFFAKLKGNCWSKNLSCLFIPLFFLLFKAPANMVWQISFHVEQNAFFFPPFEIWFDTFGGENTPLLVVVGFCVKLLRVWFGPA